MSKDAHLLLKKNGMYQDASVGFDLNRGKLWIHLEDRNVLCIEAPRLRLFVKKYNEKLRQSGLPSFTEDGYGR